MLNLYTWHTPNGKKVPILLAELGWTCTLHLVDLQNHEQKSPSYLALNPNGKIPALVDDDGPAHQRVVLFESGAILLYLAEKAGRFLPKSPAQRAEVLDWLFWQVGGPGPMFGQLVAFDRAQPRDEPACEKFLAEAKRLVGVLEGTLDGTFDGSREAREYVANEYSIADIACYPWFAALEEHVPVALERADLVALWMERMRQRPAVRKGMALDVAVAEKPAPARLANGAAASNGH